MQKLKNDCHHSGGNMMLLFKVHRYHSQPAPNLRRRSVHVLLRGRFELGLETTLRMLKREVHAVWSDLVPSVLLNRHKTLEILVWKWMRGHMETCAIPLLYSVRNSMWFHRSLRCFTVFKCFSNRRRLTARHEKLFKRAHV